MADYTGDAREVFDDIKEDGGAILIHRKVDATKPDKPWRGTGSTGLPPVPHFGLFVPIGAIVGAGQRPGINTSGQQCLIPAYGIDFVPDETMAIENAIGERFKISSVKRLNVDGLTNILFTCGVEQWPAQT